MADQEATLLNDDKDVRVLETDSYLSKGGDNTFDDSCIPQIKRLPCQTWSMLATEMCERFSYYGIKAVLVLYLTQGLSMSHANGKVWYHAFSSTSYFTGFMWAIVAESWLGNYLTILYTLVVYSFAELLLTLTSIPTIGQGNSAGPLFSLIMMAIACGNIKPCLGAFGGDQVNKKDVNLVKTYFSMFYASVNVGVFFTVIFAPMLRTNIQCYGTDCYPAVFGVNTIIIVVALLFFLTGKNGYIKRQPELNIIVTVCKIIFRALREKWRSTGQTREHWLYYADIMYTRRQIEDVRALLKVSVMFIPLPLFWALFNQQGSSWTLQGEQMDGSLGNSELRSEQIKILNPVLVLILIPLFDIVIYPILEICGIKLTSLKRMVCGMLLAALAFAITGFVQLKIQHVQLPPSLSPNSLTLDFINVSPCEFLELKSGSQISLSLPYGDHSGYKAISELNSLTVNGRNCYSKQDSYSTSLNINVANETGIYQSVLFDINDKDAFAATVLEQKFPSISLKHANSRVRTIYVNGGNLSTNVLLAYKHPLFAQKSVKIDNFTAYDGTVRFIPSSRYDIQVKEPDGSKLAVKMEGYLHLYTFGESTVTLKRPMHKKFAREVVGHIFADVTGTSVHRLWQVPQYLALTAAEIMFSVTGLEFAYSQAPSNMKSVLQALWMVTIAFGDFIVILISLINPFDKIDEEMFLYGGAMVVVTIIFAIMSHFYTYNDFSGRNERTVEENADAVL